MPRGGKRPGAGRKPGQLNKRTVARKQLAASAAREGISPLEVMLKRMRYYDSVVNRELKKRDKANTEIIDSALKAANDAAKDAAPYLHPRRSAVEHSGSPVDAFAEMLKLIDGTSRGLPDPARVPTRDLDELPAIEMTKPTQEPAPKSQVTTAPSSAAPPKSDAIPFRPAPEFAPRMNHLRKNARLG